ncbi:LOW QUALITY PROTEIN: solute carrier family 49 member A3 [Paroedura picta]|uniref:LOW QUALITY PROTEIN: solute carrier family 49 member A3 n=1 Tax=Paroedura picta TaxID=143630 RepID=UPI004056FCCD
MDAVAAEEKGAPSLPGGDGFQVYRRRWLVLAAVCLLNCSNAMLWLSFAPVADKTSEYFDITLDMVNWLALVYLVISIPFGLVAIWMLDTFGLKCVVILCAWLNMAGSIVRVLSVINVLSLGSLNVVYLLVGQCLCAMAQPLIVFAPTKLAALWFPDHQRATANMIASMSNPLGILTTNILSPALVHEGKDIPLMLGVYTGPAILACVLASLGIRKKEPPTPPSASASQSNSQSVFAGVKMLLRNKSYLVLMVSIGGGIALFSCYSSLLEQILCVMGYSNSFAGLCGALYTVAGLTGAFLLGLYVDRTKKFIETTKTGFCLCALACTAFAVVSQFRNQTYLLAVISSCFGFFGFAIYPVTMELAVECSYPVGEGTSSGLIFVASQILGVIFMVVLQSLAVEMKNAPYSICTVAQGGSLDWSTSSLVFAGICSLLACFYVVAFHTSYRRIYAETTNACSINKTDDYITDGIQKGKDAD